MKILSIIILTSVLTVGLFAQDYLGGINYEVSFTTGDTREFINKVSFRGIGVQFKKFVKEKWTVGFTADWNVFHEVTDRLGSFNIGDEIAGNVKGNQNRVLNAFPILATAHYWAGSEDKHRPFAGLGLGAYHFKQRLDIGILSIQENSWHFGISPEIGYLIPISYNVDFLFAFRWNYAFKSGDVANKSYFAVLAGFSWGD